jgi:TatD DNase family protein
MDKPKYIDIHSHLHFNNYDTDRAEVLSRMENEEVATISIGIDTKTSLREVRLAEENHNVYACVGIHPDNSSEHFQSQTTLFDALLQSKKVVAIGECGFDYSHIDGDFDKAKKFQRDNFEAQIDYAVRNNLPLMIHSRDASEDTIALLESKKHEYGDLLAGNAHFFTQSIDFAKRYLDIGFTLSFTGVVTFVNQYDEVIRFAPLAMIHAETDAPFVAPIPFRGKRNEPTYVKYIYEKIADIRGEDREMVRKTLVSNGLRLFNIPS